MPRLAWSAIERELARPATVGVESMLRAARVSRHRASVSRRWVALAAGIVGVAGARYLGYSYHARSSLALRNVEFVLVRPSARRVTLVGDFNNWNPAALPMRRSAANGVWSVVVPLSRGRHVYSFVVDSATWMPDPSAARAPEDEYGTQNSVVFVGAQSGL